MDENKDILLELAKQLISEEEIKSAVWKVVADRVDYHVSQEIGNIVRDIIHEKTEGYIREMVDDVLSQPVKTDDGWGHVEKYDSFEAFVKEKIKDKSYNRSAWDNGCYDSKIEYENAISDVEFAIDNIKESKFYVKKAEKEKKKCKY